MRVPQHLPDTWRVRTFTETLTRLDLHARAVSVMRRASEGDPILSGLRQISQAIATRVRKARSETQPPSALERLWEELVAKHIAGATPQQLRLVVLETQHLLDDLDVADKLEVTPACVLESIHAANRTCADEAVAESQLLTRADRVLSLGDIERHIDATKTDIAAKQVQLSRMEAMRRQLRRSRHTAPTRRGGLASC